MHAILVLLPIVALTPMLSMALATGPGPAFVLRLVVVVCLGEVGGRIAALAIRPVR